MFAWFLVALVALTAVVAVGVLADSGLRLWSAFGQLRRETKRTSVIAELPAFRAGIAQGGAALSRSLSRPDGVVGRATRAA